MPNITSGPRAATFGSTSGSPASCDTLGRLIEQNSQAKVRADPKTTYDVEIIRGGTTVNTIAAMASLVLDMRLEDPQALAHLSDTLADVCAEEPHLTPFAERGIG